MISSGAGKGDSAHDTQRSNNRRHQSTAVRTEMKFSGSGDKFSTDMTQRGEKYIKERCEERFQHAESESEIRIDHKHSHISETWLPIDDCRNTAESIG